MNGRTAKLLNAMSQVNTTQEVKDINLRRKEKLSSEQEILVYNYVRRRVYDQWNNANRRARTQIRRTLSRSLDLLRAATAE